MSSMVAVGSVLEIREEEREPCRVMDFRCSVLFKSAKNPGWTLRPDLGEVGPWGVTGAAGCGSAASVRRVLSLRLGRVGGGAFFTDALDQG